MRTESIRPCCGTLTDRTAPSPHAPDCLTVTMHPPARSEGPYCIASHCPIRRLHAAAVGGCILARS